MKVKVYYTNILEKEVINNKNIEIWEAEAYCWDVSDYSVFVKDKSKLSPNMEDEGCYFTNINNLIYYNEPTLVYNELRLLLDNYINSSIELNKELEEEVISMEENTDTISCLLRQNGVMTSKLIEVMEKLDRLDSEENEYISSKTLVSKGIIK